jgi:protein-tyrosine phosphatase
MAAIVIDVRSADDMRDVVHRSVQALAEGRLVAFPTETVYGVAASALNDAAVGRLLECKGRPENQPLTLAIRSPEEALDYVPDLSPIGQRLARRCWPGPITIVAQNHHPDSLLLQLPPAARQAVVPEKTVGLRVPAHQLILDVLNMMTGPLALSSANRSGQPDAITADQVVEGLGDQLDLVLDDGRSRFGQPSSVVRVSRDSYEVLREGVVSDTNLKRLASLFLLMVCTGNTCRSPMAEMLARQIIAERLKCGLDDLEDRGVMVASAGTAAMQGGCAAPQAVDVMADIGLDLSRHETQLMSERLVRHADVILTMTRGHRDAILARWPDAASRTHLLSAGDADVCDPIGGPREEYQRCADQIKSELVERLTSLDFPSLDRRVA